MNLKYAPYSFSKISSFNSCPQKFKFQYIDKIGAFIETPALIRGRAVHYCIENFHLDISEYSDEIKNNIKQFPEILDIVENFKKSSVHYALVTDEHGVFQGIITLNDILEALVGDAADFYQDEFKLISREDGSWLVDGHYSLHDFLTYFDMDELIGDYSVTTVSGLIITELGIIPKQGQKLIWNKLNFEVIDMDGVIIDKVLITNLRE